MPPDEPVHPLLSPTRATSPFAAPSALDITSSGMVATVQYAPAGSILIPVTAAGVQTFDGSGVPSIAGGSAGSAEDEPQAWDVSLVPLVTNTFNESAVYWQMRWWVKGAPFVSPIVLLDESFLPGSGGYGAPTQKSNGRVVVASSVEVLLWGTTNQAAGTIPNKPVAVAITPFAGGSLGAERFNWQWAHSMRGAGNFTNGAGDVYDATADTVFPGNKFLQGGCVGQWKVTLQANAGGSMLYPMLFDLADVTGLAANAVPIRGGRLTPVTNVGDTEAYGDQFRPGALRWQNGLVFGLSASPDVWTQPGGSPTAVVDIEVGT